MSSVVNSKSIVEFIKKNYPKVVFSPFKFAYKKAVGFIISDNNLIVGFINKDGGLCKLGEPINLQEIGNGQIEDVISRIPIVSGFTQSDKDNLLRVMGASGRVVNKSEHEKIVKDLREQLAKLENDRVIEYKVLYDSASNKIISIHKDYQNRLDSLQKQYNDILKQSNDCKIQILNQKEEIIKGINKYKEEISEFIKTKDLKIQDLEVIYNKMKEEKNTLEQKLNELIKIEGGRIKDLEKNKDIITDYDSKMDAKNKEIADLTDGITLIRDELSKIKEELSKSQMKNTLLENHKSKCQEKLLSEKDIIINKIQEYNRLWNDWSENIKNNAESYKYKLANELNIVQNALKNVLDKGDMTEKEYIKLKQSVKDIQLELQKTITEQLVQLSAKDEQIKQLQETGMAVVVDHKKELEEAKRCEGLEMEVKDKEERLKESEKEIRQLRKELEEVKRLLLENAKSRVSGEVDYENCYNILQNFFVLNNIFYRKQEVIRRLESIIYEGIGSFTNLNDTIKSNITADFEKVKANITKHIDFLDLEKYIKSQEFQYLKSKATRSKVSPQFCTELVNILEYWNENKAEYREQDRLLTNIYEDLSGAVRVYIRIKPLIGKEQKSKTVSISAIDSKKQRSLILDCSAVDNIKNNIKKTFGEFYGIFEESYTNQDVYTGIESSSQIEGLKINVDDIVESSDTISPGLYSTFKQVEDGYSIVLFGYGLSGSGKSFTLLGSNGVPGILHYGLANLSGVSNIKLKYLFEQYYRAVDVNFGKVRGNIHNLIREVPQLRKYAKNETEEFATRIPANIDVNSMRVENIFKLTDVIDEYRSEKGRIKKTPNNPVSSRSHLYLVFEIKFDTGKVGYVTIVDTAGRESPLDIYDTFIDTSKTKLASVMAPEPVGGETNIIKTKRAGLDPIYTPKHIYEVLKEGFYINETINHLVYFFNKKNYRNTKVTLQPTDPTKYAVNKYYVNPTSEESSINEANNCLTIPIMKFLDNLSNKNASEVDFKPTKFIMMCMVRQEERYCDQTFETLEFANNVKSS